MTKKWTCSYTLNHKIILDKIYKKRLQALMVIHFTLTYPLLDTVFGLFFEGAFFEGAFFASAFFTSAFFTSAFFASAFFASAFFTSAFFTSAFFEFHRSDGVLVIFSLISAFGRQKHILIVKISSSFLHQKKGLT